MLNQLFMEYSKLQISLGDFFQTALYQILLNPHFQDNLLQITLFSFICYFCNFTIQPSTREYYLHTDGSYLLEKLKIFLRKIYSFD